MSYKIPLYFITEQSSRGESSIRLMARVSFKSLDRDLPAIGAIIDTGAPTSLIPFRIWGQSIVTLGESQVIASVSDRPECDLNIINGQITLALLDEEGNKLVEDWTIRADLCHTSEMPLLLGMKDFLEKCRLVMDYPANKAWLEFEES